MTWYINNYENISKNIMTQYMKIIVNNNKINNTILNNYENISRTIMIQYIKIIIK